MRNLPSVASADNVVLALSVALYDTASTMYAAFSLRDIAGLSGLSWEVPLYGGVSKPSNYQLDLVPGAAWLQANRGRLARSEVRLQVLANSDAFLPHVGRVRGWSVNGDDPNRVSLNVYDRLLDADPLVPVEYLPASWSALHPRELSAAGSLAATGAAGYPLYYGQHLRPAFFTAVTSDCSILLGPRNVSSANHCGSLWYCSDLTKGGDVVSGFHNILLNAAWQQQSGQANVASNAVPFEIMDGGQGRAQRFWKQEYRAGFIASPISAGYLSVLADETMLGQAEFGGNYLTGTGRLSKVINADFLGITFMDFHGTLASSITALTAVELLLRVGSGGNYGAFFVASQSGIASLSYTSRLPNAAVASAWAGAVFDGQSDVTLSPLYFPFPVNPNRLYNFVSSLGLRAQLKSTAYARYAIFSPPVSSGDVAVSANPWAQLDDIMSHYTATPYRQDQSSAVQVAAGTFQFNALLDLRVYQSQLIDEWGQTCGVYAWAGDSGMVHYRAYQESASAAVDRLVTTSDTLHLELQAAPLGTTVFQGAQAGRVSVDYLYDYQLATFGATAFADFTNNAICASAYNAGIQGEEKLQSARILDAATASLALGNMVRRYALGQEYVILDLPAKFWGVELADVLRVQHPVVPGSDALYQVTRLEPDYTGGKIKVTAGRLQTLSA